MDLSLLGIFWGHDKSFGAHVAGITSRSLKIGPFLDRKRAFILEVVDCYFSDRI